MLVITIALKQKKNIVLEWFKSVGFGPDRKDEREGSNPRKVYTQLSTP